jgi:hypothetical protein
MVCPLQPSGSIRMSEIKQPNVVTMHLQPGEWVRGSTTAVAVIPSNAI